MNRRIFSLLAVMVMFFALGMNAGAIGETSATQDGESLKTSESIGLYADIVVYKFRINNGIQQYRRWNLTQGRWVDPYWINC